VSVPKTTNLSLYLSQPANNPEPFNRWPAHIDENLIAIDAAIGAGSLPRLNQVLDPATDKVFAMGSKFISFSCALAAGAGLGVPFDVNVDGALVPSDDAAGTTAFEANFVDSVEHTIPDGDFMEAASIQATLQINGGGSAAEVDGLSINDTVLATAGDITLGRMDALDVAVTFGASGGHTGVVTDMAGLHVLAAGLQGTASATNFKAIAIESQVGTITNNYGLWINDVSAGTNKWAIKTGLGLVELGDALKIVGNIGFYNHAPAAKPTVSGSRGANAALASLLTALAGLGLLTDSSS
jgi:hypothetical protein